MEKEFNSTDGILNVIKPTGISSFGCLAAVKRKLWEQLPEGARPSKFKNWKMGFLGTLDPAACGVLVLLVGKATKLADKLHDGTKVYRSIFTFGIETDTLDLEGDIIAKSDIIPTETQIKQTIKSMTGEVEIEVPKFSAVHINGRRAYDLARKGIDFTPPTKTVNVKRFELLTLDDCKKDLESISEVYKQTQNTFYFEIECETGTYVRSLARLMAARLGTVAIASLILRTRVGDFDITNAKGLPNITINDIMPI